VIFRFSERSKHALRPTQHATHSILRNLAPGLKRSGCKSDYSPNLLLRLRMSEVIPPLSHMPSSCIEHRLWYRGTISRFSESYANRWLRISIDRLKKLLIYSSVDASQSPLRHRCVVVLDDGGLSVNFCVENCKRSGINRIFGKPKCLQKL